MNKEMLLAFISNAHKHTYAAPYEIKKKYQCKSSNQKNHTDYEFEEWDFRYHDSYAWNIWAPWREVIFYQDTPIWWMSYQWRIFWDIDEKFITDTVFSFLQNALMNFDESMPFRGPENFQEGDFMYTFTMDWSYEYFTWQEKVFYKNELVFKQDIMWSIIL